MNIYDVSKKAGVSIATVSRVLNGNANVSEKTRERVLSAIKELDYTPNVFARGLGLNTMKAVGIMCTDSSDIYLANAIYYLERELRRFNYNAILCCTGNDAGARKSCMQLLLDKRVDGIILAGSQFICRDAGVDGYDYIIEAARELPIVLVNGRLDGNRDGCRLYSVLCADREAVCSAASQLIEAGRRNIVYLYSGTSYSSLNKLDGFTDAMNQAGLPVRPEYLRQCTRDIAGARGSLEALYSSRMPFDAVIASDDMLAVGAVKFAFAHGIRVPDDLEIIGYNNSVLANCTEPELTSIDNRVELVSTRAVRLLIQVLGGGSAPPLDIVAAELIKRNTTKF